LKAAELQPLDPGTSVPGQQPPDFALPVDSQHLRISDPIT